MLFNSAPFVFLFLPLALAGYYLILWLGFQRWLFVFLVVASLAFYSVWNPPYVLLLLASVLANYLFGLWIERRRDREARTGLALALGIAANLAVLGWYKYADFFAANINALTGAGITLEKIILPLAISFYTFQQIAYLTDVARGEVSSGGIARYTTFVIFFPQLIAGPIVHYREMMPQFFGRNLGRFWRADITIGLTIFAIGLFKKTVIADTAAGFSTPVFDAAHAGAAIGLLAGWKAAVCYTFQLYFDFSGYSDMAVGLGRMFGIRLPPNFHSPLRAPNIAEYWRRWHMTLQQFIVAYMYQPLTLPLARWSARRGFGKWPTFWATVALPIFTIFVAIGLWHGAAWTFVLFGTMHGAYLAVNAFWQLWRKKARRGRTPRAWHRAAAHALTLLAVAAANVMFRAETVADAVAVWRGMLRVSEIGSLPSVLPASGAELLSEPFAFAALVTLIVALMPNTQQLMGRYGPVIGWHRWRAVDPPALKLLWRPTPPWAMFTGAVLFFAVIFIARAQSEFIYFNF